MEINPEDLITMAKAARIRNCSRQAISHLVEKGRLKTVEIGGVSFLSRAEVLAFQVMKPGRKRKG